MVFLFSVIIGPIMPLNDEDLALTDILMISDPILSRVKKRGTDSLLLKLPSPKKSHFFGSLVMVDKTVYEVVAAKEVFVN